MKKVLFCLMAIVSVLLAAVTLTSCEKKEDILSVNDTKHTYTFKTVYASKDASNQASIEVLNKRIEEQNKSIEVFQPQTLTSAEAAIYWMSNVENQMNSKMQGFIDAAAKEVDDRTLTITVLMLQDGKEFKSKTWTPNPLIFL